MIQSGDSRAVRLAIGGSGSPVCFGARGPRRTVSRRGGSVNNSGSIRPGEIQEAAKTFDVVMHLHELVVQGRIRDRGEVKNRIEFFIAELLSPIKHGQTLRDEITAVAGEVLEIAGAKIVDHGEPCVRLSFLQGEHKVRADETGATSDKNGRIRVSHSKRTATIRAFDK